jgi:opacity protein-like surface antigen
MKNLLVAAAAIVAMSLPAVAADMPTKGPAAPVVPAPYNWTGFYAGVSLGWGWSSQDLNFITPAANQITSASIDTDGAVFGGHIGYQYQFGRWSLAQKPAYRPFLTDIAKKPGVLFRCHSRIDAMLGVLRTSGPLVGGSDMPYSIRG